MEGGSMERSAIYNGDEVTIIIQDTQDGMLQFDRVRVLSHVAQSKRIESVALDGTCRQANINSGHVVEVDVTSSPDFERYLQQDRHGESGPVTMLSTEMDSNGQTYRRRFRGGSIPLPHLGRTLTIFFSNI
jgi:hypothetical protein